MAGHTRSLQDLAVVLMRSIQRVVLSLPTPTDALAGTIVGDPANTSLLPDRPMIILYHAMLKEDQQRLPCQVNNLRQNISKIRTIVSTTGGDPGALLHPRHPSLRDPYGSANERGPLNLQAKGHCESSDPVNFL